MIDYKEVRIGNLVSYEGKLYKIEGISKDYPFLDTIEFGAGVVEWKDLEPIPLTEAWLLTFGFTKVESASFYWDAKAVFVKNDYAIFYHVNEGIGFENGITRFITRFIDKSFQYKNGNGIINEITYIHQLQNLYFALTNKEL